MLVNAAVGNAIHLKKTISLDYFKGINKDNYDEKLLDYISGFGKQFEMG